MDGKGIEADVVVIAMGPWTRWAAGWAKGIPQIGAQKAHSIVVKPQSEVTPDCLFLAHTNKQGKYGQRPCLEAQPQSCRKAYSCTYSRTVAVQVQKWEWLWGRIERSKPPRVCIHPKAHLILRSAVYNQADTSGADTYFGRNGLCKVIGWAMQDYGCIS